MATTERKGILKRPAPVPRAFFSFTRDMLSISRLLGPGGQPGGATPGVPDTGERAVLKRAHFIVPEMRIVYPISSGNAPSSAAQSEAKLEIDEAERLRREAEYQQAWTAARVEALYRDVCRLRDEKVDPTIAAQIRATPNAPRVLDLSRTRLTFDAASALADLLALDWGLQRLILSDCDLDDLTLKPILHALLIPDSLPYLAIANNKRLRFSAFKMIAAYLSRTYALEFIDLSLNSLDKRAVEAVLAVLPPAPPQPPPSNLHTPRMSRTPSMASIDVPSPGVQFSNPFDSTAVRPSIDTNVALPRRVKDPARYPESPGAGPSSPRGSVLNSPRGSFSSATGVGLGSPRASVSSLTSVSEMQTPRAQSPVEGTKERGSGIGSSSSGWTGRGKKKRAKRALVGIRLDECTLKGPGLEALAHAIRTSQIQTVSLRSNKIGQAGAVAVALMMKDYPDQSTQPPPSSTGASTPTSATSAGLGLNLMPTPDSSSRSTPQGSPRPMSMSLSTAGTSSSSYETGAVRPNMHSHSSLTTVSTFRERDIIEGPPSPPEVRTPLGEDIREALGNGNGHTKVPPVVAPKPKGLQTRLAGVVTENTSTTFESVQPQQPLIPQKPLTQSPVPLSPPNTKPLAPPPRHPAAHPAPPVPGTNYTAYVPRVRRVAGGATPTTSPSPVTAPIIGQSILAPNGTSSSATGAGMVSVPYVPRQTPLAVRLQNAARAAAGTPLNSSVSSVPRTSVGGPGPRGSGVGGTNAVTMITSSSLGGVTTRLPTTPSHSITNPGLGGTMGGVGATVGGGTSAALMDIVRSMEGVPKLGCLVILDLRGNDLKGGVSYIAQVLKRNRTLRSLNLSENKMEVQGLSVLAEALKYNSTLTSLDLSNNPCSSPSLEGIHALRNALTLNTTLRHLSLSSTSLTSQGAIALAEFLPDFPALQHLDLTSNSLDVAGVLALSVGLKVNYGMRCLDLSIVPGEEEMARLCREILKICLRNTERAQAAEEARAGKVAEGAMSPVLEDIASGIAIGVDGGGVWNPIEQSALAREAQVNINATTGAGVDPAGRIGVWKMTPEEVMSTARACADDFATGARERQDEELVKRTREVRAVLVEMIRTERDENTLSEMLALNDALAPILAGAVGGVSLGDGTVVEERREEGTRKEMGLGLNISGDAMEDKGKDTVVEADINAENEAGGGADADREGGGGASPVENLSRSWVAEEGEILRKGRVLLSYNELESESGADGEALRQELLEAQVERAPARVVEEEEPVARPTEGDDAEVEEVRI